MSYSITEMANRVGISETELRGRLAGAGIALGHGAVAEALLKGFVEQLIKARRRDQERVL